MASNYSSALPLHVTSPFLKNSEMRGSKDLKDSEDFKDMNRSDKRESRKSLERIEPINIVDLEKINSSSKVNKRHSREILGVDDPIVSAPDNAPTFATDHSKSSSNLQKKSISEGEGESNWDTNSVAYGGSIASTVPDKYGFMGGTQYTLESEKDTIPLNVLRRRELKWLQMLEEWDKYMASKYKKVRDRCRKGIPSSIRPRAWQYLCGGRYLMKQNKGIFDELLSQPGDPKWMDDIRKDLHRQFPLHEMFVESDGPG